MKKYLLYVCVFILVFVGVRMVDPRDNISINNDFLGDMADAQSYKTEDNLVLFDNSQSFGHHMVFTFVGDSYYEENYYYYNSEEEYLINYSLYLDKIVDFDLDNYFIKTKSDTYKGTMEDVLLMYHTEILEGAFEIVE